MPYKLFISFFLFVLGVFLIFTGWPKAELVSPLPLPVPLWEIRSIDTMKYSRDIAREKAGDASFDQVIDTQVKNIAETGASHIAIATPYDEEFVPYLSRWVAAARKYNLHVWFRGNFSGWEKWFDHPRISRAEHLKLLPAFITAHPDLFQDGDLFTPCPECENGGPGDPRTTGDIVGFRQFLIDSTTVSKAAFSSIGKKVAVGFHSMNYDVAMAVMDKETTSAVGGIVAIDHYVKSSDKMISDIATLKERSGGKIFLGEFGAPIPDIHGKMSESEQSAWIADVLTKLSSSKSVVGLNYWVNTGGSTQLWDGKGNARAAVATITDFFSRRVSP